MFWVTFVISLLFAVLEAANVGLLVVATGKYIQFLSPLVESAERHFLKNHRVTYFIFTDQEPVPLPNTNYVFQKRLGWPFDTMHRYHIYYQNRELFNEQDYLFATDADMLFVSEVRDEILGERVATLHPGFIGQRGSYETHPNSRACIREGEGKYYFAGGFYGGTRDAFLHILKTNIVQIESDLDRGIIAVWHDESHWNRYCIDYPPTLILSPSYCYPENWKLPYPKKLLALDKDHEQIRR
jgi:histo-blood group ABO system transferase